MINNIVDLLFIAETNIDDSFVNAQFMIDNYHLWRTDRAQTCGGVAAYMRSDIVGYRRNGLEFKHIEGIHIKVNVNGTKWLLFGAYKPSSMSDELFETDCTLGLDILSEKYERNILLGDLNFDMLNTSKSRTLNSICDILYLSNTVKEPTCFSVNSKPSLLDVILTHDTSLAWHTLNFSSGISDIHNLIACQLKPEIPLTKPK